MLLKLVVVAGWRVSGDVEEGGGEGWREGGADEGGKGNGGRIRKKYKTYKK